MFTYTAWQSIPRTLVWISTLPLISSMTLREIHHFSEQKENCFTELWEFSKLLHAEDLEKSLALNRLSINAILSLSAHLSAVGINFGCVYQNLEESKPKFHSFWLLSWVIPKGTGRKPIKSWGKGATLKATVRTLASAFLCAPGNLSQWLRA